MEPDRVIRSFGWSYGRVLDRRVALDVAGTWNEAEREALAKAKTAVEQHSFADGRCGDMDEPVELVAAEAQELAITQDGVNDIIVRHPFTQQATRLVTGVTYEFHLRVARRRQLGGAR